MTIFCLRDNLHRDTAPVPFSSIFYREQYPAVYQTCTATAPVFYKLCTMTAKSAPYLPCTGTTFRPRWRGVPGLCPDAASGNTNYSYHRAVMLQFPKNSGLPFPRLPRKSLRLYLENFMTYFLDLYTLTNPLSLDSRKQGSPSGKLNFNTITDFIHRDSDWCSIKPPACPSLFAYGNSRFCVLKIYKTGR